MGIDPMAECVPCTHHLPAFVLARAPGKRQAASGNSGEYREPACPCVSKRARQAGLTLQTVFTNNFSGPAVSFCKLPVILLKPVIMSNLSSHLSAEGTSRDLASGKVHKPVFMEVISKYHVSNERQAEELALIEASKNDKSHFELIYNRYHEPIFRYVYQRMDDKELAFDVTQQVFLKAMTNLHKYEYRGVPFSSWLYRIAKSEVYDVLRKKQHLRAVNIDEVQLGEMMQDMQEETNLEKYGQRLAQAIAELDEDDLQLVEMRFFEKRAFKEIGEILEMTENNAKVKLYRILERLKKVLTKK